MKSYILVSNIENLDATYVNIGLKSSCYLSTSYIISFISDFIFSLIYFVSKISLYSDKYDYISLRV